VLVSIANTAAILGAWLVGRMEDESRIRHVLLLGTPVTGIALAAMGPLAFSSPLAAMALTVSGIAAGGLQVLGPATAADAVHPEERGEAIAATGTWRAGSLFLAPLVTAGFVAVLPIGAAMVLSGAAIAVPVGRWLKPSA
jgi:MFS family permease